MKFITNNIGVKLFSLFCAIFLWIYVAAGESRTGYFPGNLSIETRNVPEGLAVVFDVSKVKVKLQAPYETWNRIGIDNFHAFVDLSGLSEGTYELDVKVEVDIPNVLVVEKEPNKIIVRLEPIAVKEVPVEVKFDGEPKTGFVTGEVIVNPDKVKIKGAKSLIENISQATALVQLSGEGEGFKKTVLLAVYDDKREKLKGIEFNPDRVEVDVPIEAASEAKTVGVKPKIKGRPKGDYYVSKIETEPATVEITGSNSDLQSILYIETEEVDISGLDKDLEKSLELLMPKGITSTTKNVKVKISLSANVVEREIAASTSYLNKSPSTVVQSLTPNIIKVVISCPLSIANTLSSNNVSVAFDLQGKTAGSYLTDISKNMLSVPNGCAVSSWLPSAVTIVLQ